VYADIVRCEAKAALNGRYAMDYLPNSGLMTSVADSKVRIRKAEPGEIPAPTSKTLRDFYQQQLTLGLESAVNPHPNLLLLWSRNFDWSLADSLILLAPRGSDDDIPSVDAHWAVAITDGGTTSAYHHLPPTPLVDDLQIRPRREPEIGLGGA